MVTKHVFYQSLSALFNFGHFFCPFLKSQNTFGITFSLKYNKFPKQLKEITQNFLITITYVKPYKDKNNWNFTPFLIYNAKYNNKKLIYYYRNT